VCSVFVLVRIRGDAESLQDASDALVSALLVHLAPRSAKRDARISCPLARTKKAGSAKALPAFLCGLAQEDLKGSGSE
jgi:hypothetical protein